MVIESCVNHPLDTLKTRYQLISNIHTQQTQSLFEMSSHMLKSEGLSSFYRGLPMVIVMQAPRGFLKFGTNYSIQQWMYSHFKSKSKCHNQNRVVLNLMSGLLTGMLDGLIVCPFELIKVRMQSADYRLLYKNTWQCLLDLSSHRFALSLSLFRGLELTLWRNASWHAIYFACLGQQKYATFRFCESKFNDFMFGCIGGAFGSLFSSPFDVAKSRIQNTSVQIQTTNTNAFSCVYRIYNQEGFVALYRGLLPKLIRLGFGGGILIFSFECSLAYIEMVHLFCTRTC
jgi:solute carrier family 25 2-oxodicarboxylate transporter 21